MDPAQTPTDIRAALEWALRELERKSDDPQEQILRQLEDMEQRLNGLHALLQANTDQLRELNIRLSSAPPLPQNDGGYKHYRPRRPRTMTEERFRKVYEEYMRGGVTIDALGDREDQSIEFLRRRLRDTATQEGKLQEYENIATMNMVAARKAAMAERSRQ